MTIDENFRDARKKVITLTVRAMDQYSLPTES